MTYRKISCTLEGYDDDLIVEVDLSKKVKIPKAVINKALMIAMNYLIENMEIADQEEPE